MSFMALVLVGVVVLWAGFSVALFLSRGGDCAGTEVGGPCDQAAVAEASRQAALAWALIATVLLVPLAVLRGRRLLPAVLLVASLAMVVLGWTLVDRDPLLFAGLVPGAVLIAMGSAWQLARYR